MSVPMEKMPRWVKRLLISVLESRVRSIVREEVGHLETVVDERFEGLGVTMNNKFETVDTRIDSLERQLPTLEKLGEIRLRLADVERRLASA